ncbi:MAG: ThuA domain-containing protein [Nocardioides sp.]|uniref:ThuA domain-containing protein n=1 Tax=Nocardioides sp. TaxID=35761 RepID=UPI0039E2693A
MTVRALIIAGRGRYEDPWHDHAATSWCIASELHDLGHRVDVRSTFHQTLHSAGDYDLVVVNAGTGRIDPAFDGGPDEWQPAHEEFADAVRDGLPVLAMHQSANTFNDSPGWHDLLGGQWIPGQSFHPPEGPAEFDLVRSPEDASGVLGSLDDVIRANDERYCALDVATASTVLVTTTWQGTEHPVAWRSGAAPSVIYDGLGHSTRSYESRDRALMLRAELKWLANRVR